MNKLEAMSLAAVSVESVIPEQRGKPHRGSVNAALFYVNRLRPEGELPVTRSDRPISKSDRPMTKGERPATTATRGGLSTAKGSDRPQTRWETRTHDAFGVPSEEDAKLLPALPAVSNWKKKRLAGQAAQM